MHDWSSWDVPAEAFPFEVAFIDYDTDEELTSFTVIGPGVVSIPSFRSAVVGVRIRFADGTVAETPPARRCPQCGKTTFNINDVRHGYCGSCDDLT